MSSSGRLTCVLASVLMLVALLPIARLAYHAAKEARFTTCRSNLQTLAQAMTTYAADNEGRLPERPWPDVFEHRGCPDDRSPDDPSYALHHRWLREPLVSGNNAIHLILLYESTPGPFAYRHYRGMNVGFVDGHVKFYKETDLTPAQIIIGKR